MKIALSLTLIVHVLAPFPVTAQPLQSFEHLALRVNLDDQLRVEDQSGISATGRLTRLTRDEITIRTDAGEKQFTSDGVRQIAVRGQSLGKGALIGAGVFTALGAVAAGMHGENAVAGPLGAAVVGAGVGLALGAAIPRMKTVYRPPEGRAAGPRALVQAGGRASLLEDLGLRVNLGDRLLVEDRTGARITGPLAGLTDDDFAIQTDAGTKHFTRDTVRQVALRHPPLRVAVLIGAAVGAAAGAAAACAGSDREECADGVILLGGLGAGAGLAVGALMPKTTIVYPDPGRRSMVVRPAITRNRVAVRISRRW